MFYKRPLKRQNATDCVVIIIYVSGDNTTNFVSVVPDPRLDLPVDC